MKVKERMRMEYNNFILETEELPQYRHLFTIKERYQADEINPKTRKKTGNKKDGIRTLAYGVSFKNALDRIARWQVAEDNIGKKVEFSEYIKQIDKQYSYLEKVLGIKSIT